MTAEITEGGMLTWRAGLRVSDTLYNAIINTSHYLQARNSQNKMRKYRHRARTVPGPPLAGVITQLSLGYITLFDDQFFCPSLGTSISLCAEGPRVADQCSVSSGPGQD